MSFVLISLATSNYLVNIEHLSHIDSEWDKKFYIPFVHVSRGMQKITQFVNHKSQCKH